MAIFVFDEDHDGQERGFGALETSAGALPLAAIEVRAHVTGLAATTRVRQRFVNTHDRPLEATYVFPLPDRGAVRDFRLRVAGREVVGELKERGQARQEYAEAIASGHRAAIAEEERPDVFTMRVGNLPPGEEAVVELELVAPLDYVAGEAEWRFPLVVAPRYVPGTPLPGADVGAGVSHDTDAAPDASRVTPPTLLAGFPNPVELDIQVTVDAQLLEVGDVRATLHAHEVSRDGHRATLRVVPGARVDRDFILRFTVGDASSVHALASRCATPDGRSAFELVLAPPQDVVKARTPRDVVFVLDRSGSMGGWKMVAARRAVGRMLDTLSRQDRFNVIAFDNTMETMPEGDTSTLTPATNKLRWRAVEYLSKLEARGGTQMLESLLTAARQLQRDAAGRERSIVLVTDGQIANEDQVLRELSGELQGARVFTVGIDRAVNAGFLRRLAQLGSGFCELVEGEDRLDEVMDRVHMALEPPALTELTFEGIDGARIEPGSTLPGRAPALFTGSPLVVRGLLSSDAAGGAILVRGARRDGSRFERTVPLAATDSPSVGALWARARVRALEDDYVVSRGSETEAQIIALSLTHKVLCRFTSFVAVDRVETIDQTSSLKQVTQPVEAPDGWADGIAAPPPPSPAPRSMPAPTGGAMPSSPPMQGSPNKILGSIDLGTIKDRIGARTFKSKSAPPSSRGGSFGDGEAERTRRSRGKSRRMHSAKERRAEATAKLEETMSSVTASESFDDSSFDTFDLMETERAPNEAEGSAPTLGRLDTAQLPTGVLISSTRFLSPEAIRGEVLDARADVWSLAALLFEAITGTRLFDEASGFATLEKIASQGVDVSALTTALASAGFAGFAAALVPALQSDRATRWGNLGMFADVLDAQIPALPPGANARGDLEGMIRARQVRDAAELVRDVARALHGSGQVHGGLFPRTLRRSEAGSADVVHIRDDGGFIVEIGRASCRERV